MSNNRLCSPILICYCVMTTIGWNAGAQVNDDVELAPGLVFESDGVRRLANQVAFSTERLGGVVRWQGNLESQASGEYRLAAQVQGRLEVKLQGTTVLATDADDEGWLESDPIPLEFDAHPLQISLQPTNDDGATRLTLFWSGPGFPWEPVPAKRLFHRKTNQVPAATPTDGSRWVRALRCEACHDFASAQERSLRAPSLGGIRGNLHKRWLVDWLTGMASTTAESAAHQAIRRLHGEFNPEQAADIVAHLHSISADSRSQVLGSPDGDAASGRELFLTVGCLACHQLDAHGTSGPFAGGDLAQIAAKRPATFFDRWLADPASVNPDHRMPVFDLTPNQRADLSKFLTTLSQPVASGSYQGSVERGRQIVESKQCAACHRLQEATLPPPQRIVLDADSEWSQSCMLHGRDDRPNYRIEHKGTRRLVQDAINRHPLVNSLERTELLIAENNCLHCHARNRATGLAPVAREVAADVPSLSSVLAALAPPSLNSVGDKLHRAVLHDSISRRSRPHRPWLQVRMPKFNLDESKVDQLADYFIACDRVPDQHVASAVSVEQNVGERLVTADGFGCTSCHAIGKSEPDKAELKALGPDLSMLGRRVRKTWFDRWVRNPIRIVPRMEMPSMQLPVMGILDNDLQQQLDAVWAVLNQPGFNPPDPHPVRTIRGTPERTVVLTDVLSHRTGTLTKPLLIGLPNGHNVLFDLEQGTLAGWWTGITAKQRTKGKTWYWQSGADGWIDNGEFTRFGLFRNGQASTPSRVGQFITEPDLWMHRAGGLEWQYRLTFPTGDSSPSVLVTETILGVAEDGWQRTVVFSGLKPGDAIKVTRPVVSDDAKVTVDALGGEESRWLQPDQHGRLSIVMHFESAAAAIAVPAEIPASAVINNRPTSLRVVPGFEADHLGLPSDVMPIALTWRPDGRLLLASLKGRIWLASDVDGDELEDDLLCISDELAAPYGLQASESYTDVVNKYGVLRLQDLDGDDVADRTSLVASGWGHTPDYHDWAVGLPMDEQGNYYVAIPCQQDDRSSAATRYRGCVLRLRPRTPDVQNPRLFAIEQVSGGHRFPMGIARNREGQLVVTDNQGNYNPFNELNHVIDGKRYGFINRYERSPGFRPELTPPAIAIPHPWTRSVNGICFLETPESMVSDGVRLFGPFEGHLLGCEYDTRRLIRMSVEMVDGVMQGAAYPFSLDAAPPGEATFQGPICCGVAPDGDVYVGNIRDSGWGGANNTGSVVRLAARLDQLPCGIAEVKIRADGFQLFFTQPVDPGLAGDVANYSLESYRRESTPAYGGDDIDRRKDAPHAALVDTDRRSVTIKLGPLRLNHVYEFKLKNLTGSEAEFFPAEAHYTVRRLPAD